MHVFIEQADSGRNFNIAVNNYSNYFYMYFQWFLNAFKCYNSEIKQ